ncbi:hypothetical protein HA402_004525 [Bradysia odoriphaga]|nr:hypothetical protein HA402_004525 [Bradysia odoriphaga]
MMKPKVVNAYIPEFDTVAKEFVNKIKTLKDDKDEMPDDFQNDLFRWALESISLIALEQRLGLLSNDGDQENQKIINAVKNNLSLSYQLDVEPSLWKYLKTPKYRKLMNSLETMTNVSKVQIDKAIERLAKQTKREGNREESVLEKILQINENYAMVMSLDMLSAGIHSTVAATAGLLYNLAKNQRAQDKFREEALSILPTPETQLTSESFNSLPYMRASLKESMRITPVFSGNFRGAGRNMVIQGYQIPVETHLILGAGTIVNHSDFVERPDEFIPERFLKEVRPGCPNSKDIHPFLLLPFGFGPRHCVGKRFAELEIEILMMRFLTKYKVEWNYGPLEFARQLVILPSTKLKYKVTEL